jgi:translation initiation factor 1 (eIF-1/SUI1)
MDTTELAVAVVSLLAPFTPFLVEGGKKFAGHLGDAAWNKAQQLWNKLMEHFKQNNKLKGKLLTVSAEPENQAELKSLSKALAEEMAKNPKIAEELFELLGGSEQAIQEIVAEKGSWVKDVKQEIQGGGKQKIKASDHSKVSGVVQKIQK